MRTLHFALSLVSFGFIACSVTVSSQDLRTPSEGQVVRATIPHFEWASKVAYPWPGTYRIEIASDSEFRQRLHQDEIPAILEHYSPAKSLPYAATPLHWRLQYVNTGGEAAAWKTGTFLHQAPTNTVKIPLAADWKAIHAAFIAAKDKASETKDWVALEFEKGTYALTQEKGDAALFEATGKDGGVLVEGNGATFLITATEKVCGVMMLTHSSHAQFRNFTVDYTPGSLGMLAGTITAVDHKAGSISVQILSRFVPSLPELGAQKELFFIDAQNFQRIPGAAVTYETSTSWGASQASSHTGLFHFTIVGKKSLRDLPLKVGDLAITGNRGGDVIKGENGSNDLLFENITTLAARSRLLIPRGGCTGFRVINCNFTRARTGLLAAPSGGVNSSSSKVWIEGCKFEGTRDDSVNLRTEQNVFRNCQVSCAYRNSMWLHGARHWIVGNTFDRGGVRGISVGGTGIKGVETSVAHAVVIENNTFSHCNGSGMDFGAIKPSKILDPLANLPGVPQNQHSDIRITGNTFIGTACQPIISIRDATNVYVLRNRLLDGGQPVPENAKEDPPTAIHCENVTGYHEEGTVIQDKRIRNRTP
jgi:hypothetical protein